MSTAAADGGRASALLTCLCALLALAASARGELSGPRYKICFLQPPAAAAVSLLDHLLAVDDINRGRAAVAPSVPTSPTRIQIEPHYFVVSTEAEALEAAIECRGLGGSGIISNGLGPQNDVIVTYTKVYNLPVVSGSLYSAMFSDKQAFPFMARTVAPDSILGDSLLAFAASHGWYNIGILTFSGDSYVDFLLDNAQLWQAAVHGINIVERLFYDIGDANSVVAALDKFKASSSCLHLLPPSAPTLATAIAGLIGPEFVWVTAPSSYTSVGSMAYSTGNPMDMLFLLDGIIEQVPASKPEPSRWAAYRESWSSQSLSDLRATYPTYFERLPAELQPSDDVFASPLPETSSPAVLARGNEYDAVLMLALGLQTSGQLGGAGIFNAIVSTPFEGLTGLVQVSEQGDRLSVDYMSLNYRLNLTNAAAPFAPVPASLLSWSYDTELWNVINLPFSPATGLQFNTGSPFLPLDNFQCPQGVCELCWVMPAGYEFLMGLMAVDHFNTLDETFVPGLSAQNLTNVLRPHMKVENQALLQQHSQECSNFLGHPMDGVIGAADIITSISLQQNIMGYGIPQISPWLAHASLTAGANAKYANLLPGDNSLAAAALWTAKHFGWNHLSFLVESHPTALSLSQYFNSYMAEQGMYSISEHYYSDEGDIMEAMQDIKDNGGTAILLVNRKAITIPARAAFELGLCNKGYAWLVVQSEEFDGLMGGMESYETFIPNGWMFLSNSIQIPEPKRAALAAATKTFDLHYYIDKYPEAFELVDVEALPDLTQIPNMDHLPMPALAAYDSMMAMGLALSASGGAGSQAVFDAIKGNVFSGLTGEVALDSMGTRIASTYAIFNYQYIVHETGAVQLADFVNIATLKMHSLVNLTLEPLEGYATIRWPGNFEQIPNDGYSCPAGQSYDKSALQCQSCLAGTYLDPDRNVPYCTPCPAGTFCNKPGCKLCVPCDDDYFQDTKGAMQCTQCPSGTDTGIRGAESLMDCTCSSGFFRMDSLPGLECSPCPLYGICDGGAKVPYPKVGAWGYMSIVDSESFSEQTPEEQTHNLYQHLFVLCDAYGGDCGGTCGLDAESSLLLSEQLRAEEMTNISTCRTVKANLCGTGYQDRICYTCQSGFFRMLGICRPCPEARYIFVIGGLCSVVFVWFILNKVVANRYESLSLMLSWLQIATMISTFRLNWHPRLKLIFELLTVVNFDIDFFPPDCIMAKGWAFGSSLTIELLLPITWIAVNIVIHFANLLLLRTSHHKVSSMVLHMMGMSQDDEELERSKDARVASSVSFMNITYHTTTIKCLSSFMCTRQADGSSFLNASPSMPCYNKAHVWYMCMAGFGFCLYSIGLPVLMGYILRRGRKDNLFETAQFTRRYGWLYLKWEADWFWWELVFIMRRVLFSLLVVFGAQYPSIQAGVAIVILLMSMGAQFYSRAFLDTSLDIQDSLQLCSLIAMVIIGQWFYDQDLEGRLPHYAGSLLVVLLLLMGLSIAVVLVMAISHIATVEKRSIATRYLKHLCLELKKPTRSTMSLAETVNAARAADRRKKGHRDLHEAFNVDMLYVWVQKIRRKAMKLKAAAAATASRSLASEGGERSGTNTGPDGRSSMAWAEPNAGADGSHRSFPDGYSTHSVHLTSQDSAIAERLWELNDRWVQVREGLKGDGAVKVCASYYNFDRNSSFYRSVTENMPYLLDYLLICTPDQREQAYSLLSELQKISQRGEERGLMADVIVLKERANMVLWLLTTDQRDVTLAQKVLNAIWARSRPPKGFGRSDSGRSTSTKQARGPKMLTLVMSDESAYRFIVDLRFLRDWVTTVFGARDSVLGEKESDSGSSDEDGDVGTSLASSALVSLTRRGRRRKKRRSSRVARSSKSDSSEPAHQECELLPNVEEGHSPASPVTPLRVPASQRGSLPSSLRNVGFVDDRGTNVPPGTVRDTGLDALL